MPAGKLGLDIYGMRGKLKEKVCATSPARPS